MDKSGGYISEYMGVQSNWVWIPSFNVIKVYDSIWGFMYVTISNNTFSYYCDDRIGNASYQFNASGIVHYYCAMGLINIQF